VEAYYYGFIVKITNMLGSKT